MAELFEAKTREWLLGQEVGRGSIGRVVRVHCGSDGHVLAGKLLHASLQGDAHARARLEAESRLLFGLRHPNLVSLHGLFEIDGERVLLMDFVDGPSLATLVLREGPLPLDRALAIARGIAAGLATAHRQGVIHRDLKPANVLIAPDGTPRVADFGLARAVALSGVAAGELRVVGTPAYMAPEAIDPRAVDVRSDLYALGCILYDLLLGAPPFLGATAIATLDAHRSAARPTLSGVPPKVNRLLAPLLAVAPADRPASAEAVERALAEPRALSMLGASSRIAASACVPCGAPLIRGVPVCFACATPELTLSDGNHSVFVVEPGTHGHRLDAMLRERLLRWIEARPALGLNSERLSKAIPRLPFTLITGVNAEGAFGLADALREIGLDVEVLRGNRLALSAMRRQCRTIGLRALFLSFAGCFAISEHLFFGDISFLSVDLASSAFAFGFRAHDAARPVCKPHARLRRLRSRLHLGGRRNTNAPPLSIIGRTSTRSGLFSTVRSSASCRRRKVWARSARCSTFLFSVDCGLRSRPRSTISFGAVWRHARKSDRRAPVKSRIRSARRGGPCTPWNASLAKRVARRFASGCGCASAAVKRPCNSSKRTGDATAWC